MCGASQQVAPSKWQHLRLILKQTSPKLSIKTRTRTKKIKDPLRDQSDLDHVRVYLDNHYYFNDNRSVI